MAVLVVAGTKGGCGKSTLATNLLVAFSQKEGIEAVGIDVDPQETFSIWARLRAKQEVPEVEVRRWTEPTLHKELQADSIYVVDVGARDSQLLRSAIVASAVFQGAVVIPVIPSGADLWALEDTLELIKKAREAYDQLNFRAFILLNQVSRSVLVGAALKYLEQIVAEYDVRVLKSRLGARVAYRKALAQGLSVLELNDQKAQAEVRALADEILVILKGEVG